MMIFNYIKIALRHLIKNKVYALVSIVGLGLGLACCILISLYIIDELGYDKQHKAKDRIYRVQAKLNMGSEINAAVSNRAVGPTLMADYPEVESYARFMSAGTNVEFTFNDRLYRESNVWFADSTVFDVFTYPIIAGSKQDLLKTPNSLVISRAMAEKIFGSVEKAIGEQLGVNNSQASVQAVMEDIPSNNEIIADVLISSTTLPEQMRATFDQDWFRISVYTFLKFKDSIEPNSFQSKLDTTSERYVKPWAEANGLVASVRYSLTPLTELHFTNDFEYDLPKGDKTYILIFSLLATFILIVAAINFVNLSLAQSSKRAKEVGIRKTLGANRLQIAFQFIGEAVIITCLAVILGLALVELLLNSFNEISNKNFTSEAIFDGQLLLILGSLIVLVGILAGSYPAFVMSSFRPVTVLRGNVPKIGGVGSLRKGLMLIQFAFSLFMITGTLLIGNQMDYMQGLNLGFDRENVLSITLPSDTTASRQLVPMLESYRTDSRVLAMSRTNMPTGQTGELMFRIEGEDAQMIERSVRVIFVDEHFMDVLGLSILDGRNFSNEFPTDQTQAFIINSNAVKAFGWQDSPLNKRMQWGLQPNGQASNDGKVVGVVNDFNFLSLHNPMEPLAICYNPNGTNQVSLKLSKGDFTRTLDEMQRKWEGITSKHPFNYTFLDQSLENNYMAERNMYAIFKYFAFISIAIALLGLFALISFSVQVKTKEIGIRKILGASSASIAWALVHEFVLILVVAFMIATPLNVYLMNRWLEQFAYQVSLSPSSPAISLAIAALLSAIVVFYHTYRINRTDPAQALRYE
jgi:putative ABC transport system permease protein